MCKNKHENELTTVMFLLPIADVVEHGDFNFKAIHFGNLSIV